MLTIVFLHIKKEIIHRPRVALFHKILQPYNAFANYLDNNISWKKLAFNCRTVSTRGTYIGIVVGDSRVS